LKALVQEAFALHQKGEFSAALPVLRRAYALEPSDYFVNLLLGIDLLRTGQPEDAVPHLKKASHIRPKEEFPLDYLGEAYAKQQNYADAAKTYLKAMRVAPGSSDSAVPFVDFALSRFDGLSESLRGSNRGLAAEYRLRGLALPENDASRLSALQHAADLDGAAPGIWTDLATTAVANNDSVSARRYVDQALTSDPNDLKAWALDAQLAAQSSDWQRAVERLSAVAQRSPSMLARSASRWPAQQQPPQTMHLTGSAAMFFSCVRERKTQCDLPLRKRPARDPATLYREQRWEELAGLPPPEPGHREAWLRRGIAFASLKNCAQAIPPLERGIAKSEPEVFGMFLLSWCYSLEAGDVAGQIRQSGGDEAALHIMRGDILLRLQAKADAALGEYEAARQSSPNDPAVLERLAEAQFALGKTEESRNNAQAALKIDSSRIAAKRTLVKIAMQERDYASALPYLRELVRLDPRDVTLRIDLGRACAQTGVWGDARRNLAPVLANDYPDEKGSLHYLLGTVLKKLGRSTEADQAFAAATRLSEAFQKKSYHDQDADAKP
jgi:tetratricopeptide (TPR) repeat protein